MRSWRWGVVALGVALLVALPAVVALLPASGSRIRAQDLLDRVRASAATPYSGLAESNGGLALPVTTTQFSSLADLFGDTTRMRVWWRSATDWRVDRVNVTGEVDVHQSGTTTWTWDYEANTATMTNPGGPIQVRLPTAGDLLPANLGRRLLSQAEPGEVSRLGERRIAGRSALGLRLTPALRDSTIARVDVWADRSTGVPLRVEMYGRGSGPAVLQTSFLDFTSQAPSGTDTAFVPPDGARLRTDSAPDLAAIIARRGTAALPTTLAAVARNESLSDVSAIGIYGHGVSEFAVAPVPGRVASSLRGQLENTPGVTEDKGVLSTSFGPLGLVLLDSTRGDGDTWLLTGTVTTDLLRRAAAQLPDDPGLDG